MKDFIFFYKKKKKKKRKNTHMASDIKTSDSRCHVPTIAVIPRLHRKPQAVKNGQNLLIGVET